ncbi:hypothetical protein BSNK01_11750 [Bacillaceae bacterium]
MCGISKVTRGSNLLWESSRMILPEHKQALNEHRRRQEWEEQNRRPELDEQELQEMTYRLQEAFHTQKEAVIKFWDDREGIVAFRGVVSEVRRDRFRIVNSVGRRWIMVRDVIDVEI